MKRLALALAASLFSAPVLASTIESSGTQPYACTVVGDNSISLVSVNQNQLSATGTGYVYQNGDTEYTLSTVTATGPDNAIEAVTSAIGGVVSLLSSHISSDSQQINGELSQNINYTVSVSSADGILAAGDYTTTTSLTCTAAP